MKTIWGLNIKDCSRIRDNGTSQRLHKKVPLVLAGKKNGEEEVYLTRPWWCYGSSLCVHASAILFLFTTNRTNFQHQPWDNSDLKRQLALPPTSFFHYHDKAKRWMRERERVSLFLRIVKQRSYKCLLWRLGGGKLKGYNAPVCWKLFQNIGLLLLCRWTLKVWVDIVIQSHYYFNGFLPVQFSRSSTMNGWKKWANFIH